MYRLSLPLKANSATTPSNNAGDFAKTVALFRGQAENVPNTTRRGPTTRCLIFWPAFRSGRLLPVPAKCRHSVNSRDGNIVPPECRMCVFANDLSWQSMRNCRVIRVNLSPTIWKSDGRGARYLNGEETSEDFAAPIMRFDPERRATGHSAGHSTVKEPILPFMSNVV